MRKIIANQKRWVHYGSSISHSKLINKTGDTNIYYVDGLKIFGPGELKYLPDKLYPNATGQFILAENFIRKCLKSSHVRWKYPSKIKATMKWGDKS